MIDQKIKLAIENEIRIIESKSSVEIVPVYLNTSSQYRSFYVLYVTLLPLVAAMVLPYFDNFSAQSSNLIVIAIFVLGAVLFSWRQFFLVLIPKSYRHFKVEQRAKNEFLEHQVFATRQRTGLLLLVSELEKAVYILADRGLIEKIPVERWKSLATKLAHDFNIKSPGQSFLQALKELEVQLETLFPKEEDDKNELQDHLR